MAWIVVPHHDTHPLLLEDGVRTLKDACLRQRQTVALTIGTDDVAEGRMRGEHTAQQEAFNAVRGYVGYMHATDADPPVDVDDCVWEDDIINAALAHAPDEDDRGSFSDPVPALVAEVRRLQALVAYFRAGNPSRASR